MEFLKNHEHVVEKLHKTFEDLDHIYWDDRSYQEVKLYDVRNISFEEQILSAVRTVFAVVRDDNGRILLVEHPKRGWEICGGHLSQSEVEGRNLKGAVLREVLEESGYDVDVQSLAFLAHVYNKENSINKELGCLYPSHALMATFFAQAKKQLSTKLYDDMKQAKFFDQEEAVTLVKSRNRAILESL